jgi:hypothetical protein
MKTKTIGQKSRDTVPLTNRVAGTVPVSITTVTGKTCAADPELHHFGGAGAI